MKRLLRVGLSLLIIAAAGFALYRECLIPWRCNQQKKLAETMIVRLTNYGGTVTTPIEARRLVEMIDQCLLRRPEDVDLWVEKAALLRLVERHDEAIAAYQKALSMEKRPEIYAYLGITQAKAGQREEAIASLVTAARFSPNYLSFARDADLMNPVRQALREH